MARSSHVPATKKAATTNGVSDGCATSCQAGAGAVSFRSGQLTLLSLRDMLASMGMPAIVVASGSMSPTRDCAEESTGWTCGHSAYSSSASGSATAPMTATRAREMAHGCHV